MIVTVAELVVDAPAPSATVHAAEMLPTTDDDVVKVDEVAPGIWNPLVAGDRHWYV